MKAGELPKTRSYMQMFMAAAKNMKISIASPFYLLLFLLILQGYIDQFSISIWPFGQYRILHLGLYFCFCLFVFIFLIRSKNVLHEKISPMIFVYVLFIIVWTVLGISYNNYSLKDDATSLMRILLIIIISFYSYQNDAQLRKTISCFILALLPLCFIQIVEVIAVIFGFIAPQQIDLGRYLYVLIFGYTYYLAKVLTVGAKSKMNMLFLLTFAIAVLISFLKSMVFAIICSTIFMIVVAINKAKIDKFKIIVYLFFVSIAILLAFQGFNMFSKGGMAKYYQKAIINYYIKGAVSDNNVNVSDAFYQRVSQNADFSSGRFGLWTEAWKIFEQNIIFGRGIGVFIPTIIGEIEIHNIYLYFLACGGILGTTLMVWILFYCTKIFIKGLNIKKNLDLKMGLLTFIFGAMCFNMTDIFMYYHGYLFMFSICFGLLLIISIVDVKTSSKNNDARTIIGGM